MTWTMCGYVYLIVGALWLIGALAASDRDLARDLSARGGMTYAKARSALWVAALLFILLWPFALLLARLRPRRRA